MGTLAYNFKLYTLLFVIFSCFLPSIILCLLFTLQLIPLRHFNLFYFKRPW